MPKVNIVSGKGVQTIQQVQGKTVSVQGAGQAQATGQQQIVKLIGNYFLFIIFLKQDEKLLSFIFYPIPEI